jgi:hypothetical protein
MEEEFSENITYYERGVRIVGANEVLAYRANAVMIQKLAASGLGLTGFPAREVKSAAGSLDLDGQVPEAATASSRR